MNCFEPELLSAFAALAAIVFAIVEALIKFHGKNAERTILFYAKYLYICQQIEIGVLSIHPLVECYSTFSEQERIGYAKAHMLNTDIIQCIYEFEELSFSCLKDRDKRQERKKVQKALEFGSHAVSLIESINSFYQSELSNSENRNVDSKTNTDNISIKFKDAYDRMNRELKWLKDDENLTSDKLILGDNEDKFRFIISNTINKHRKSEQVLHGIYFVICFALCLFCVLYILLILYCLV